MADPKQSTGDPALAAALRGLPHGPAFRFVDALVALDPGLRAVGRYRLRGDEAFLAGHFPGAPMMPGVLMVEAIAQVAGIAAQQSATDPPDPPPPALRLTAVHAAKILAAAVPGDTLCIEAEITGRLGPLVQAAGTIALENGARLATARITLSNPAQQRQ